MHRSFVLFSVIALLLSGIFFIPVSQSVTEDYFPDTETATKGTVGGAAFPGAIQTSDDSYRTPQESNYGGSGGTITFVGTGLTMGSSTGVDITIPLNTGTIENDIIVVIAYVRDVDDTATATGDGAYTAVSGTPFDRSTIERYWIFWKRATASEVDVTFDKSGTTGDTYGWSITFRNVVGTGNPFEAIGTPGTGTTDPATLTGITSLTANAMILVPLGYSDNNNNAIVTTGTNPATYTESYIETVIGDDGAVTFSRELRSTAGPTGTVSVDFSTGVTAGDGWGGMVLALKPALPADYEVETKYDFSGISTSGNSWTLIVECKRGTNPENGLIQVVDSTETTWVTRYTCDQNADTTYSSYALSTDELDGGSPNVRIIDSDQADESLQSTWDLDVIKIVRDYTISDNPPTLTQYYANPYTITYDMAINFGVIYTDIENVAPTYIKLTITTAGTNRTLSENNTGDTTYSDGKAYYLDDAGSTYCPNVYSFFYSTSDGVSAIRTPTQTFNVSNTIPDISNGDSAPLTVVHGNPYSFDFDATDIDVPTCQSFTWTKESGPSWLSMASGTGILSGDAPDDLSQGGNVAVRVSDGTDYNEYDFDLTITNTNPSFTSGTQSSENTGLGAYTHDYNSVDSDPNDSIYYTFETDNAELNIGAINGTVWGFLTIEGTFYVNVTVHDQAIPNGTVWNNYTLNVLAQELSFVSEAITDWVLNLSYEYQVAMNQSGVTFALDDAPFWLSVNASGFVYGVPSRGSFNVSIRATKGVQTVWQNYTLVVSVLSDLDWLLVVLFAIFIITIVLGFALHPAFHLLSGVAGFYLAFVVYDVTDSGPIAFLIVGVSSLVLVLGLTRKDLGP